MLDQGADDLTARHPVGLIQPAFHPFSELLEPSNHQPQFPFIRFLLGFCLGLGLQFD